MIPLNNEERIRTYQRLGKWWTLISVIAFFLTFVSSPFVKSEIAVGITGLLAFLSIFGFIIGISYFFRKMILLIALKSQKKRLIHNETSKKLMYLNFSMINKLSLPAVILISSIILGGVFYATEVNKQKSVERQQQVQIDQERQDKLDAEEKKKEEDDKIKQEKSMQLILLNSCLSDADKKYWSYVELNGIKNNETGVITARQIVWDTAKEDKKAAEDVCYKKYSN